MSRTPRRRSVAKRGVAVTPKTRPKAVVAAEGARVAIVRARWNDDVTRRLARSAVRIAKGHGAHIRHFEVAGSFELPTAVALLARSGRYDAVVPVGCLIRGETAHFDVLANAVCRALLDIGIETAVAIPFGVLACDTVTQALARSGGEAGDAGAEAMVAALELVALRRRTVRHPT